MKRTFLSIIAFLCVFAQSVSAQTGSTETSFADSAEVTVRFYDRTLYYPGKTEENPVYVHITIANNGTDTLRFKLADDRMFSIDFLAFNVKNTQLSQTQTLRRKRTTNQTVYFREIALEPGEEYSFVENVKDYLEITDPSIYYLELKFYPELYRYSQNYAQSNRLSLEIRPSPSAAASSSLPVEATSASLLQPESISPDRVVEQTIIARQKGLWDQYFLYIDLEELLKRDPSRSRRYNNASASDRSDMLAAFKAELMQNRIDNDIVAIPARFQIDTTTYSQTEGTVRVTEWFNYKNYAEKKRYTYYVRQRDGIWQIYNYTVDNLGTESL